MSYEAYQKKKGLKLRNKGSKLVVYDYERGMVVELNESAKLIWSLLDTKPVEELVGYFRENYRIDLETAKQDVYEVLKGLEENGIISCKRS